MKKLISYIVFLAIHSVHPLAAMEPDGSTNIVFIMVDDAGIGDFSAYGCKYGSTPNIDRMADEGMLFTRAYSASAVCAPTRCMLMTGQHGGHALLRANMTKHGRINLPEEQMTVARMLKGSGYATGGFGKWGLGDVGTTGVPEKQGFDLFYGYYDQAHAHNHYPEYLIRNSKKEMLEGNADGGQGTCSHDLIVDETIKFIEKNQSNPFFCYAAWTFPHGQYVIPPNAAFSDTPWPEKAKSYATMIAHLDRDVGRLMDKLKELGLDENTMVVFTSDNGTNDIFIKPLGSNGGLRGHKRMLYEGGIRTPFIVRWPGRIAPGTKSELLTSHVDVMATAAEIASVPLPGVGDGISILPTLLGNEQRRKHDFLYFEIYEPYFQQAVRTEDWKGYRLGTRAPLELFNLKADPGEKRNVAGRNPEAVRRIEKILAREHTPSPHWNAPANPRRNRRTGKAKPGAMNAPRPGRESRGFALVQHDIDTTLAEGDGLSGIDMNGDGRLNPVIGTGKGGQVYWFERGRDGEWIRHLIAQGYKEIEGTIAADFNGDGRTEVVFFDQATNRLPGLVVLARQTTDDPRAAWSTVILDGAAHHAQQGLVHDVDGDGHLDFYYSYEGSGANNGGFYWMRNLGGDPIDPANWVRHTIDHIPGAWWIDGAGPRDFNGDGTDGDILVSVRESRNADHSSGAVLIYHRPADPLNGTWRKSVVVEMPGNDITQVTAGDFTGSGDSRDVAIAVYRHRNTAYPNHTGLHLYHRGESFGDWKTHTLVAGTGFVAVRGRDFTGDGVDELVAMAFHQKKLQLWARDEVAGVHTLRADHPFTKGDDLFIPSDITGDGKDREFFIGSDPNGLFWFEVTVP